VEEDLEGPDENARKFYEMLKDANKPLHDKTKHSKLGAIVRLYSLKCMGGLSNALFSFLLEFINELIPPKSPLPKDTYEAKKYMKDLGLEYQKIPCCPNGCMLFWKEYENLENYTTCKMSKRKEEKGMNDRTSRK